MLFWRRSREPKKYLGHKNPASYAGYMYRARSDLFVLVKQYMAGKVEAQRHFRRRQSGPQGLLVFQ